MTATGPYAERTYQKFVRSCGGKTGSVVELRNANPPNSQLMVNEVTVFQRVALTDDGATASAPRTSYV